MVGVVWGTVVEVDGNKATIEQHGDNERVSILLRDTTVSLPLGSSWVAVGEFVGGILHANHIEPRKLIQLLYEKSLHTKAAEISTTKFQSEAYHLAHKDKLNKQKQIDEEVEVIVSTYYDTLDASIIEFENQEVGKYVIERILANSPTYDISNIVNDFILIRDDEARIAWKERFSTMLTEIKTEATKMYNRQKKSIAKRLDSKAVDTT